MFLRLVMDMQDGQHIFLFPAAIPTQDETPGLMEMPRRRTNFVVI